MKKINLIIYLIIVFIVIALVGVAYFLYSVNKNNNNVTRTSIDENNKKYQEYVEPVVKKIAEKVYGVPVKTEPVQQPIETVKLDNAKGEKISIAISINSLNADLILMEDRGQTPWMDYARMDSELNKFEKTETEKFLNTKATWQAIINDSALSQQVIEKIRINFIPEWEAGLNDLQKQKKMTDNVDEFFTAKFGIGDSDIPQKYKALYQYNKDVGFILADIINLSELNLRVKEQTIKDIQNKDANAATIAANDEDRISLVISWYEERLNFFAEKKEEMSNLLEDLEEYVKKI